MVIIILVVTVLPIGILAGWFYHNISEEYKRRANIYLEQISNFSQSVINNKALNLEETLRGIVDYIAGADPELLYDLKNSNITTSVIGVGGALKNASGLDILEILDEEGRILSSGHWEANYGNTQRVKLPWVENEPLYYLEKIISKSVLTIQMKDSLKLGDKKIYVIGGYVLSEKNLLPEYLSPEVIPFFSIKPQIFNNQHLIKEDKKINKAYFPRYFADDQGKVIAVLDVKISTQFIEEAFRKAYMKLFIIALILIVVSINLGIMLSKHITKPLEVLVSASSEIAKGNLEHNIDYKAKGEIGSLIYSFNYMILSLREAQKKLIIAERLNAWREAARRIAHEIKNPISPIQVCIKTLMKAKSDMPHIFDSLFDESAKTILEEVSKLHTLADSFSLFAQMPNPVKSLSDLNALIKHIVQLYKPALENVKIKENYYENLPLINMDSKLISAALHNIIKNAVEALPKEEPLLSIKTFQDERDNKQWVIILISDNGKGIKKDALSLIFQPYYTTKSKGTGLGLTIAKDIIAQHHGYIKVESQENIGTTFIIELPIDDTD